MNFLMKERCSVGILSQLLTTPVSQLLLDDITKLRMYGIIQA